MYVLGPELSLVKATDRWDKPKPRGGEGGYWRSSPGLPVFRISSPQQEMDAGKNNPTLDLSWLLQPKASQQQLTTANSPCSSPAGSPHSCPRKEAESKCSPLNPAAPRCPQEKQGSRGSAPSSPANLTTTSTPHYHSPEQNEMLPKK